MVNAKIPESLLVYCFVKLKDTYFTCLVYSRMCETVKFAQECIIFKKFLYKTNQPNKKMCLQEELECEEPLLT
jgi:hypothetical protein